MDIGLAGSVMSKNTRLAVETGQAILVFMPSGFLTGRCLVEQTSPGGDELRYTGRVGCVTIHEPHGRLGYVTRIHIGIPGYSTDVADGGA